MDTRAKAPMRLLARRRNATIGCPLKDLSGRETGAELLSGSGGCGRVMTVEGRLLLEQWREEEAEKGEEVV